MRSRAPFTAREMMAYSLVILGAVLVILSATGLFDDQSLEGPNYCGTPLAFPVCAQISSQSGQFVAIIAIGVAMAALGVYLASRPRRARRG